MPDSPTWLAGKAIGDRGELAVAEYFRRAGFDTFKTIGRADFDLLLTAAVEVKVDRKAATTGNVAVEVAYAGQPSGVMTSPATYWAFLIDDEAIIVRTEGLRAAVLARPLPEVDAGDGHKARVRLLPVKRLRTIAGAYSVTLTGDAP